MAIKSKVFEISEELSVTKYLYCEAQVKNQKAMRMLWLENPDRDQEIVGFRGAQNELQLLEVDDLIPDEVENHPEWLQVDETEEQAPAGENPGIYSYAVNLDSAARQAHYEADLRAERNLLLEECQWYCQRHRDQLDNSESTSLSGAEFTELLNYRKALRDWPEDETDIYARSAPSKPGWM